VVASPSVLILGTGYVGLTCAGCFGHLGHTVVGFDIDTDKIASLKSGQIPIYEPGLDTLITDAQANGNLSFTTEVDAIDTADIIFLCLPTPPLSSGTPDLSILKSVVLAHRERFKSGAILVTKSTVPLGTSSELASWLDRPDISPVSNPEFLREGVAVDDFLNPDRVVVGAVNAQAGQRVLDLYESIQTEVIQCDPLSAELIKYAANAFLATKLSFVNELARICDEVGADVDAVVTGLGTDHRISSAFLSPGPGWGGSCFPKDVAGLAALARSSRLRVPVIESATESNRDHFDHILSRIRAMVDKPLSQATVAVWGLAFKAGTDDTRSSPAVELIERLDSLHCTVQAHDPVATVPTAMVKQAGLYEVCEGADLLVIATEWPEFASADFGQVAAALSGTTVFDLRSVVSPRAVDSAGLRLELLGRSATGA
jgi:UDPglucose 6-dehydrogenase